MSIASTSLADATLKALRELLDTTIASQGADMGNIQLLNADGVLEIVVQRGFQRNFLEHFRYVSGYDECACGKALRLGTPVLIADVERSADFAPHRAIAAEAGFRAVQSVPLVNGTGSVLGVLSVHYQAPLASASRKLRSLGHSASRIAAVIRAG